MEGRRVKAQELQAALQVDLKALTERIADAINLAQPGRIIADSEELVRDAAAVFRQKAYQRVLDLLRDKALQEGFSPSKDSAGVEVEE